MTHAVLTHGRDPLVPEQFEDAEQQRESATLGMWTFLATEVLFFGGVFLGYTFYRLRWPEDFRHGSLDLKWYFGAINTGVLLGSSFTMALAVHAASHGERSRLVRYLLLTIGLAVVFLLIKASEYTIEYREHLVPGLNFAMEHDGHRRPPREYLFMSFYFVMTGIHATHMIIGIGVMAVLVVLARRGWFSREYHNPVEMAGLYWHFVDIVWVFLFPMLYLLRHP
jgi:cytochrome c oxidase subunit 3